MIRFQKNWIKLFNSILPLILSTILTGFPEYANENQLLSNPGEVGPCSFEEMSLDFQGIEARVFIPAQCSGSTWSSAPYPGLVFAHGITMLGFTDGAGDVADHGEHLASWGYGLVIPTLPEDAEVRTDFLRIVFD